VWGSLSTADSITPDLVKLGSLGRVWLILLALAGLLFLGSRFRPHSSQVFSGMNDFMNMYTGARLVGSPDQFRSERYAEDELSVTGFVSADQARYLRLPVFAFALRPLTGLPYPTAYYVWQALSFTALVGFVALWPGGGRGLLLLAACWSFPLMVNFVNAQDVTFLLLFLVLAWRYHASLPWVAGICFALCALKFHLFLLVPVLLIAQRKWRVLAWGAATLLVLLAASTAVSVSRWIPQFIGIAFTSGANPYDYAMPNLHALVNGLPNALRWELAGDALVIAAVAWFASRSRFSMAFSATLIGGLLISHHAYFSDALVLLPALLIIMRDVHSMTLRLLAGVLLSPLPFLVYPKVPFTAPVPVLSVLLLIGLVLNEWIEAKSRIEISP
jgi:Glycosyltransferase family 87